MVQTILVIKLFYDIHFFSCTNTTAYLSHRAVLLNWGPYGAPVGPHDIPRRPEVKNHINGVHCTRQGAYRKERKQSQKETQGQKQAEKYSYIESIR